MKTVYTAEATATGDGRNGHVRSSDGLLKADLSTPKEMGGSGTATNPEQLFAAGYAACFHGALLLVARRQKVKIEGTSVTAAVGIGPDGDAFRLTVTLTVDVPSVEADVARGLVDAAHEVCPYSRATRGNIDVEVKLA